MTAAESRATTVLSLDFSTGNHRLRSRKERLSESPAYLSAMGLDVPTPDPPELREGTDMQEYDDVEVQGDTDYRRAELEEFLRDGAWDESFGEWTEHTDLDEREFEIARDLGLFAEFDFFWDNN